MGADVFTNAKAPDMSTFTTGTRLQGIWDYIEKGQTDLLVATVKNDPSQLRYRIGHAEDTPLHVIARQGDAEMMKEVLKAVREVAPEHIDIRNKTGNTPLMTAGANGREENAKLLMDAGADVDAQNNQGENLLMKTIKGRNQEDVRESEKPAFDNIIRYAVEERKAKIGLSTHSGNTAIDMADLFEDDKTMSYLETRLAEQKAAKPAPTAARAAPVSKLG